MNSSSNKAPFYLLSSGLHLALLALLLVVTYHRFTPDSSFQTIVQFEARPSLFEPKPEEKTSVPPTPAKSSQPDVSAPKIEPVPNLPVKAEKIDVAPPKIEPILKKDELPKANKPLEIQRPQKKEQLLEGLLRSIKPNQPEAPKNENKPSPKNAAPPQPAQIPDQSAQNVQTASKPDSSTETKPQLSPGNAADSQPPKESSALSTWRKNRDTESYDNQLKQLVRANWKMPTVKITDFAVVIEVEIDPEGNLINIKLLEKSGLAVIDSKAISAIRDSAPFPKFPDSFDPSLKSHIKRFRFTPDKEVQ